MELLDSLTIDLFKIPDVNQRLKRGHRAPAFQTIFYKVFGLVRNQHEFPSRRIDFNTRTYFVRPKTCYCQVTTKLTTKFATTGPGSVFHPCSPKWDEIREDIARSRLCQTWGLFLHKAIRLNDAFRKLCSRQPKNLEDNPLWEPSSV